MRQEVRTYKPAVDFLRTCTDEVIGNVRNLHNLTHAAGQRLPTTPTEVARSIGKQGKADRFTEVLRFAASALTVKNALLAVSQGEAAVFAKRLLLFWSATAPFLSTANKDTAQLNPPQTYNPEGPNRYQNASHSVVSQQQVQSQATLHQGRGPSSLQQTASLQTSQLQMPQGQLPYPPPPLAGTVGYIPVYPSNPYQPMPTPQMAPPQMVPPQTSAGQFPSTYNPYEYDYYPQMTAAPQMAPPQMSATQLPSTSNPHGYDYNPQMTASQQLPPLQTPPAQQVSSARLPSIQSQFGQSNNPPMTAVTLRQDPKDPSTIRRGIPSDS